MAEHLGVTDLRSDLGAEPRIFDERLAEALGMSRARDIRKLIANHRDALARLGQVCATVAQTRPAGGRPATAYWLNQKQALYLCTKSEAPLATEVTLQMVEVFDAWLDRPRLPAEAETPALPPPAEPQPWPQMCGQ